MIYPSADETAFRVLTPSIRLYGLAVYALTTTFTSALAATVAGSASLPAATSVQPTVNSDDP